MENSELVKALAELGERTKEKRRRRRDNLVKKEKTNKHRSKSEVRIKENIVNDTFSKKPHLSNNNAGKKISSTVPDMDLCSYAIDSFESVLAEIEVDKVSRPIFLQKLKSLQKKIEIKIQGLADVERNLKKNVFSKFSDSNLHRNSLSASELNLCSVESNSLNASRDTDNDILYQQFLKKVNCPFCSEPQIDKFHSIKHLNEDCISVKNKSFTEDDHFPYSAVQILPNNTFKCNVCPDLILTDIKFYFIHVSTLKHKLNYGKIGQHKQCTKFLFCSACKTLVPDTYTDLKFHINHPLHKSFCNETEICDRFIQKKVSLVFTYSKKFRCNVCPRVTKHTLSEIMEHSYKLTHKKSVEKSFGVGVPDTLHCLYCAYESTEPSFFKVHFDSIFHQMNLKKKNDLMSMKLCLFCGGRFSNLTQLFTHMASACDGVEAIRGDPRYLELIRKNTKNSAVEYKKQALDVREVKNNDKTEENCIWFTGCADNEKLSKLKTYLGNFGDIASVKQHPNKSVQIQFKDCKSVERILVIREIICADCNVEIIDSPDENQGKHRDETSNQKIDSADESGSDDSSETDSSIEGNRLEMLDLGVNAVKDFFQKFSVHLLKSSQKLNDTDKHQFLNDCTHVLDCDSCTLVGFQACELPLPKDNINLFCKCKSSIFEMLFTTKSDYLSLKNQNSILDKNYCIMKSSKVWEDIKIIPIPWPYFKCKHVATQNTCTITFMDASLRLTDMLKHCLKQNGLFQPFSLTIRFWFKIKKLSLGDSDYPLMSLLIFFFTNSEMVSLPYELDGIHKKISLLTKKGNTEMPASVERVTADKEVVLFKQFFIFLKNFNFNENAICLPLTHPVPKTILISDKIATKIIDAASIYKSRLCIMDPFCEVNLASDVTDKEFKLLFRTVKRIIKNYKW